MHGYLPGRQRPEQLVYVFRGVVGEACIEPTELLGRTTASRQWMEQSTQGQGIPVPAAPKGVRKEEPVRPFTITCSLNGHHVVSERLRQAGVTLYQQGNAILSVTDPTALQAAADALRPAILRERRD